MVCIELSNRGFANVITAMHDAINILEDGSFFPTQEECDDIRSNLRNAMELMLIEGEEEDHAGVV